MHQQTPQIAQEPTYTRWKNPLKVSQRVDIHMDGRLRRIEWPPGGEKELPSTFDGAIQRVENGVITGGLAPALHNMSASERPRLHEALDGELQARIEREARAAAALIQARSAESLALIAEARVTEPDPKPAKK